MPPSTWAYDSEQPRRAILEPGIRGDAIVMFGPWAFLFVAATSYGLATKAKWQSGSGKKASFLI